MKKRVRAIIRKENNILLIHRIKKGKEYWVFPGGGVEDIDENNNTALIRECKEELGLDVLIGDLFTIYNNLEASSEKQEEYFYFCKITGGELGTGTGLEFQQGAGYEGMYALEWMALEDFSLKNIQPEEVKKEIIRKLYIKRYEK